MKTGGRLVKHARYYWLLLAQGHLNRRLFGDMLSRIGRCLCPEGNAASAGQPERGVAERQGRSGVGRVAAGVAGNALTGPDLKADRRRKQDRT